MEEHKQKSIIENLSPKSAFKTGLISGLAIMFAIGFFVLLGMMLTKGDNSSSGSKNVVANNQAAVAANNQGANAQINIEPVNKDTDWIKGDKNAKITVVEFSDLECPFCKRFHSTMQQVVDTYDGQVNWVYRHFPLSSLHSKAPNEAQAAECAGELGGNDGFWKFVDRLFEITPANNGLDPAQLPEIAKYAGLDVDKFQTCLDSGKYAKKIQEQAQQAQAAGAKGTPYSVIIAGDKKVPIPGALPFEQVKAMIDSVL